MKRAAGQVISSIHEAAGHSYADTDLLQYELCDTLHFLHALRPELLCFTLL